MPGCIVRKLLGCWQRLLLAKTHCKLKGKQCKAWIVACARASRAASTLQRGSTRPLLSQGYPTSTPAEKSRPGHRVLGLLGHTLRLFFKIFLGLGRPKIIFKNDPEPRGVIFPKFQPIWINGDPFRTRNRHFRTSQNTHICYRRPKILIFGDYMYCKHRNMYCRYKYVPQRYKLYVANANFYIY